MAWSRRPRRDALRHRRVDDAARRCTPRSPRGYWQDGTLWPWELCEMFNLAAAVERGHDVRHHSLRGDVLPDVAGVLAAVADTDRADAPPRARPQPRWPCGRAIRKRRSSPSPTNRPALLQGLNVVGTVLHAIDTDRFDVPRDAGRLPALSRPLHRRQGRTAGDRRGSPSRA